ncbi:MULTISPECIES: hypothetical protein [unclassified Mycobacterium]|uniref:ATP dependent DNA ligase n=1 Tax=unclassified Mycobacterium TaxID=2642494 RepID=UPI0021032A23|nr:MULTISPECIES: hypothetical protein [unclassified Mycobacterium]
MRRGADRQRHGVHDRHRFDATGVARPGLPWRHDREAGAHWVCPEMVVQTGFSEWTRNSKSRHPRYLGVRTDKEPGEVVRETH